MCLKSNGTVHAARTTSIAEKKHCFLWCHNSYGFENQIQHSVTTTFFCTFFCQSTFFVTVSWKFDKIKNFRLFFSSVRRMSFEQSINLKFLVRLGKTPIEALKFLHEVYSADAMSRTRLFEWHRRFKERRGDGRWSQEWEAIHKQNGWKCWAHETKSAERSPSHC